MVNHILEVKNKFIKFKKNLIYIYIMYLTHNIFYMFIFTFIVNMFILPLLISNSYKDITINMNKIYLSIIFGLLLVISQGYSFDILHKTSTKKDYIIYIFLLVLYIYLYRNQMFVNDKNLLKDIKEKNSSIIQISKSTKTKNPRIKSFYDYINNTLEKQNGFINKIV